MKRAYTKSFLPVDEPIAWPLWLLSATAFSLLALELLCP